MINILVVEDTPLAQMAIKFIFKSFDCRVDFAKTGEEALEKLKKAPYDIVFFDLGLPDISGLDLLERIRRDEKLKHLRLVVLTAHTAKEYEKQCLAAGAEAFFTKPLKEEDILALLAT